MLCIVNCEAQQDTRAWRTDAEEVVSPSAQEQPKKVSFCPAADDSSESSVQPDDLTANLTLKIYLSLPFN